MFSNVDSDLPTLKDEGVGSLTRPGRAGGAGPGLGCRALSSEPALPAVLELCLCASVSPFEDMEYVIESSPALILCDSVPDDFHLLSL